MQTSMTSTPTTGSKEKQKTQKAKKAKTKESVQDSRIGIQRPKGRGQKLVGQCWVVRVCSDNICGTPVGAWKTVPVGKRRKKVELNKVGVHGKCRGGGKIV